MAILLENLKKQYIGPDGSVVSVIDVPHFLLEEGEQIALVGTSGSGKTTLLHLIAGILLADSGRIVFNAPSSGTGPSAAMPPGQNPDASGVLAAEPDSSHSLTGMVDITQLTEAQRDVFRGKNIGYIFQTHNLLAGFTALENVLLGMSFTGRGHDLEWARHLLGEVGLGDRLNYRPSKLSVGQQQRVAVARALANRPKLVLADEPTGALDERNAQQVLDLIRKLCTEVRASLILVTHDMNIARQLPKMISLSDLNRAAYSSAAASV